MPKSKISKDKEAKKEGKPQKGQQIPDDVEEQERRGILPDDVDFRRGMGCG